MSMVIFRVSISKFLENLIKLSIQINTVSLQSLPPATIQSEQNKKQNPVCVDNDDFMSITKRKLTHTGSGRLYVGVCRNKKCWDGTCGWVKGGGGGHGCTCAYDWTCHKCWWDNTDPLWPNYLMCTHLHNCKSCKQSHDGGSCPASDSIGCRPPSGTDANSQLYTNCDTALTKKAWTADIKQVHNEFDPTLSYFGNRRDYLDNAIMECFVHCTINNWISDPKATNSNVGGPNVNFGTYMSLDKKLGRFSYYIKRPFYWTVNFHCDNGFMGFDYSFKIEVACHSTSTEITQRTSPDTVEHQTVHIDPNPATRNPSHVYRRHNTAEYNCPLNGHLLRKNLHDLQTLLDNNLQDQVFSDVNQYFRVQVKDAYKLKRGYYEFYVYRSARGGAYWWSPLYTLNVTCGPSSTVITQTSNTNTQTYEIGSFHGWYFQEFTQSTDCPIEHYRIVLYSSSGSTADHHKFPKAPNVYDTRQFSQKYNPRMVMKVFPENTKILHTYSFRIEATALGGAKFLTNDKNLKYTCYPNYLIFTPPDFDNDKLYYESKGVLEKSYYFSKFTTSHKFCNVTSYKLDNDNNPGSIVAPTQARFNPTCVTEYGSLCREVLVKVDQLTTYSFWIVVDGHGGMQKTFEVKVQVKCGIENITVTGTPPTKLYDRDDSPSPPAYKWDLVNDVPKVWSMFSIDSTLCPISKLLIWADEQCSQAFDSNVTLINGNNPSTSYLQIKSDVPIFKKTVYIQAVSVTGRTNLTTFTYTICGHETLNTTNLTDQFDFFYWYETPDRNEGLEWGYLDSFFKFELGDKSVIECYDQTLKFFKDPACLVPWVNPNPRQVDLENNANGTQRVHVWTDTKFREQVLYMKRETKGKRRGVIKFAFEVCGLEKVSLVPNYKKLEFKLDQFQGNDNMVRLQQYQSNFETDSRLCKSTWFKLYVKDKNGNYVLYTDTLVAIEPNSHEILIKTHLIYSLDFWIAPIGHSNQVFLPVSVQVIGRVWGDGLDKINKPPYLRLGIKNVYENVTEITYKDKYSIQLSQFMDDLFEWKSLRLSSRRFGRLDFSNETGVTNKTDRLQIMDYDPERNTIDFRFSGFSDIMRYKGLHTISVTLFDARGLYSNYYPNITFNVTSVIPKFVNPPVPPPQIKITGYIESISQYGLTKLKFSSKIDQIGLEYSHVNSSALDVYVEPYRDYQKDQPGFNLSKLNLTWNCLEILDDTMTLNIDFSDPHWISSQTDGRDQLVIHIKNTLEDSPKKTQRRRRLVNDGDNIFGYQYKGIFLKSRKGDYFLEKNSTMKAPLRRQYSKSEAEQILSDAAEGKKTGLKITILVGFLMNLLSFSSSFYFISAMNSSLQLAIHLPIMNFLFPSNVMIYLSNMIPIVMYDILDGNEFFMSIFESEQEGLKIYNIRPQVSELTYDSHNPFFNLGTLSLIMLCVVILIAFFIVVVLPLNFLVKRVRKLTKKLSFQSCFTWLLYLCIEGYHEILITIVLCWSVPKESFENIFGFQLFSWFAFIQCCLVMPILFCWLMTRNIHRFKERHFKIRWGALFHKIKLQNKPQIFYYGSFIIRRMIYVYLIAEGLINYAVFQVIFLVVTNFFQLFYFTQVLPKQSPLKNWLEVFNEVKVYLCTLHLYVFSPWVKDMDTQYLMGWVFIILLSSAFLLNILFIAVLIYKEFRLIVIKYWRLLIWYLKKYCKKKPKPIPPPPPPPPPPPKPKVDSYQPQLNALRGGKAFRMVDADDKEINRVMQVNMIEDDDDNDKWKHQAAPAIVRKGTLFQKFSDLPQLLDNQMVDLSDASKQVPTQRDGKMVDNQIRPDEDFPGLSKSVMRLPPAKQKEPEKTKKSRFFGKNIRFARLFIDQPMNEIPEQQSNEEISTIISPQNQIHSTPSILAENERQTSTPPFNDQRNINLNSVKHAIDINPVYKKKKTVQFETRSQSSSQISETKTHKEDDSDSFDKEIKKIDELSSSRDDSTK